MASIILKKSSVAARVPVAGDLAYGELALNYADGKLYYKTASNTISYFTTGTAQGTITSVAGAGTVSGLTLTGTVTSSGSLTLGGTLAVTPSNFASQTANTVLAAPNGATGTPTFRTLVAADIPTLAYLSTSGGSLTGVLNTSADIQQNNATYLKGKLAAGTATRLFGLNASNTLYIGSVDADHTGGTLFVKNGVTQMALDASGNLSLGTATPNGTFTVSSATTSGDYGSGQIAIRNSGSNNGRFTFALTNTDAHIRWGGSTTNGALIFSENDAGSERMRLSAGNLLIGTTTSSGRLTVYSTSTTAPAAHISGATNTTAGTIGMTAHIRDITAAASPATAGIAGQGFSSAPGMDFVIGKHWSGTASQFIIKDAAAAIGTNLLTLSTGGALNTAGAITQNGSQVLHVGNYNTYALPLTGGTLTGELTIATGTSTGLRMNTSTGTQSLWVRAGYDSDGTATPVVSAFNIQFQSSGSSGGTFSFVSGNTKALTIGSSAINSLVPLQQNGNQVLHTGNYTSYAYTKAEVDSFLQGLDPKQSVLVATTANITLSAPQTIDGIAVAAGDRVLVKNQTTTAQNGIYIVAAGAWTRALDMDIWAEVPGTYVFAEKGTTLADTGWVCTADISGTLGTTAIPWIQFAGAGTYTGTAPITVSGTTISHATSGVSAGTYNNVTVNTLGHVTGGSNVAYLTGTKVDSISATTPIVASAATGAVALSHATSGVSAGTYNNVTVNATGHVTGGSNTSYLTAESDTLATVTARGASTSTASTFSGGITAAGATLTGNLLFANATSPNTNYIQFGDNTGWFLRIMTNVSGTPTERFKFGDNGTFNATGTISQNGTAVALVGHTHSYLTAESDTLATVTARGATTTAVITHGGLAMSTGTNVDQVYSVTDTLTLTTSWQDTTVNAAELASGSYVVQIYVEDSAVGGGHYQTYYTGMMSWFSGDTNETSSDEIVLHRAGHASNSGVLYLRVLRTATADVANLKLQIAGNTNNTGTSTYTYKFRRLI